MFWPCADLQYLIDLLLCGPYLYCKSLYPPCADLLYFYKIKTKGSDDIGQCGLVESSRFQGGV